MCTLLARARAVQRQHLQLHKTAGTLIALRVPAGCLRALLPPGAAPPAAVGLQLFLDGRRHGGRFPAEVNAYGYIARDVARLTELEGCAVVGWRVAAPRAVDVLVESGGGGGGGK